MESFDAFTENADAVEEQDSKSKGDKGIQGQESTNASNVTTPAKPTPTVQIATSPPAGEQALRDVMPKQPTSPSYPQLSNTAVEPPSAGGQSDGNDEEEDELNMSKSFHRTTSPSPMDLHRHQDNLVGKAGEEGVFKMHKYYLFETMNYYYILGTDLLEYQHRFLKISRTSEPGELDITEDDVVYSKKEAHGIIHAVNEGNKATGGLKLKTVIWGILGFIRFTSHYYMIYVTRRSQVALIGGHYIYTIEKTEMVPLITHAASKIKSDRHIDESRYMNILNNLDLTKSFYYSYSYDCTRTLQHNIMREREALQDGLPEPTVKDQNSMFVWNDNLLEPARAAMKSPFAWCVSIIHGYVDQAALSVYWGRVVYVTLIARRSRFFAGARYLKRGANDLGHVANDVETEQIVSEMRTTSFHAPGPSLFTNPNWTSYVQHRGSIPLHWMQDTTGVSPKPDIHLSVADPFYSATALHFDDMFQRYGTPIYVLNLIKQKERVPRETKLLKEYKTAIDYLNQFLPDEQKILYRAWDMSRAQKSRDQDVIGTLDSIADDILPQTGFFKNGNDAESGLRLQIGVVRTNCIDCLDRTNAAQFVIGKKALGHQLQALGVVEDPDIMYDSDAINLFTHMWHDHGDTIAVQYGGSHLVNTMSTYRKINQWQSQSRDMVETFKRYYNNSFMDSQRQEAYNLFLGNYKLVDGQPMIWELASDYYLHHDDPRSIFGRRRPSYRQWYTQSNLTEPSIPPTIWPQEFRDRPLHFFDDFWIEYYRPLTISNFKKQLPFKMHSNMRYIPVAQTTSGKYDLSPFKVRTQDRDQHSKQAATRSKGVKIIAPSEEASAADTMSIDARLAAPLEPVKPPKPATLGPWLDAQQQLYGPNRKYTGIIKESSFEAAPLNPRVPKLPVSGTDLMTAGATAELQTPKELTKAEVAIQAFASLVASSIDPTVSQAEAHEYFRYVSHPSTIPLVVDTAVDYTKTPAEFLDYLSRTNSANNTTVSPSQDEAPPSERAVDEDQRGMSTNSANMTLQERAEQSFEAYAEFVESGGRDEPLTVLDEDGGKKRYKAYRQWLRGKSLFKQRLVVGGEVV